MTLGAHDSKIVLVKRPAEARGRTELGWLHSRHTFSFGDYFDADQMGFRSLRVINEDIVEPGHGFGTHFHRDAEIFSYVIEGGLEHKDSQGNGSVIKAGNLQYMSAGNGVRHSEFNPSKTKCVHFLQVWMTPSSPGGEPRYSNKRVEKAATNNALTLLLSGEPQEGAISIRLDANVHLGRLDQGRSLWVELAAERFAWVQVIAGQLTLLGEVLKEGDGASVVTAQQFQLTANRQSEFLLFDLP